MRPQHFAAVRANPAFEPRIEMLRLILADETALSEAETKTRAPEAERYR
jgi:hypothetical protein